jgi:hypothetical protein
MTAKTARSKKAKGSKLEKRVASEYRRIGIEAQRMPLSGAVPHMRGDIWKKVYDGWIDECKCAETIKLNEWWTQAKNQSGRSIPVLHISGNFRPVVTVVSSDTYYDLCKQLDDTGQPFQHKLYKVSKKRFNFWLEWEEIWNSTELGDPILHIEHLDLTVMQMEHYFEIRDCLQNAPN